MKTLTELKALGVKLKQLCAEETDAGLKEQLVNILFALELAVLGAETAKRPVEAKRHD